MNNSEVIFLEEIENPIEIHLYSIRYYSGRSYSSIRTTIPHERTVHLLNLAGIPHFLNKTKRGCFISANLSIKEKKYQRKKIFFPCRIITNVSDEIITSIFEKAKIKYNRLTKEDGMEYLINFINLFKI